MMIGKGNLFVGVIILIGMLWGCRSKPAVNQDTLNSGVIRIAVDATLFPLLDAELAVFEALTPAAGIVPAYTNETRTINLLLADSVRLAVATRPLTAEEMASFHSRKFFPQVIRIATDGIALIVNLQNNDTIVNTDMLRKILSGKILRWKDLYGRMGGGNIRVAFDDPNSSTVRYMLDSLLQGDSLSENCFAAGSNRAVVDYVSRTPDALGVIGVNWISDDRDSLSMEFLNRVRVMRVGSAMLPNARNSFQPYPYYLYTGQYPLRRSIYILLNDPRSGLPTGLASFLAGSRGQRIVLKNGLLPATMPVNIVNITDE